VGSYPLALGPAAPDAPAPAPVEYAVAVNRYLGQAALSAASRRVYRISLAGWAWPLVGKPIPGGPERRGAAPPVVPLALLDDPGTADRGGRPIKDGHGSTPTRPPKPPPMQARCHPCGDGMENAAFVNLCARGPLPQQPVRKGFTRRDVAGVPPLCRPGKVRHASTGRRMAAAVFACEKSSSADGRAVARPVRASTPACRRIREIQMCGQMAAGMRSTDLPMTGLSGYE
jgi:hypothetical protein